MTLLTEAGPRPAAPVRPGFVRRHRRLLAIVASLVVAAGLAAWLVLRHFDSQYGPFRPLGMAGPYSERNLVFGHDDSVRLSAQPGAQAQVYDFLHNDGSHSVKITSIDGDTSVASIRWSTYRVVGGGNGFGVDAPWRQFPAVIPAQGAIRLLVTIQRPPTCPKAPQHNVSGGAYYSGSYQVHWDSLLSSHTATVQTMYGNDYDIQLC